MASQRPAPTPAPLSATGKYCKRCRKDKPLADFIGLDGQSRANCRACRDYKNALRLNAMQLPVAQPQQPPPPPPPQGPLPTPLRDAQGPFCTRCLKHKPITEFYRQDGRPYRTCNDCRAALGRARIERRARVMYI